MEKRFEPVHRPEGWVSASPLPDPEELRAFYATLYYQHPPSTTYQTEYGELELRYKELRCAALLHALARAGLEPGGSLLDIGAGEGFLMDAAHRQRHPVIGLDFSSFAIEKFFGELRDQLIVGDVFDSLAQLAARGDRFAACCAINVLEHVIDPTALLDAVRGVLQPSGVLALTVPNDFSRLQKLLRDEGRIANQFWFAPPQHLHYFNAENLPRFCASRGYKLIDAFSDFPIDLFLMHPGSNYVMDAKNGPAAHHARMRYDLLIAEAGLESYLAMYRALFNVGVGRNITVIVRPGR